MLYEHLYFFYDPLSTTIMLITLWECCKLSGAARNEGDSDIHRMFYIMMMTTAYIDVMPMQKHVANY